MKLKYKIWLDDDGKAFGEGPYQLLKGIKSTGSLAQAAKLMNMSYSRAHTLMKALGNKLGFPLIESQAGGRGGGLTIVTHQAEELMSKYDDFIGECDKFIKYSFCKYFPDNQNQYLGTTREHANQIPITELLNIKAKEVISLVGGGGKTSIMYGLAKELSANGAKVILATSTHVCLPTHGTVDRFLIDDEKNLIRQLCESINQADIILVGTGLKNGRIMSVSSDFIDHLLAAGIGDYIIIEADGAARKPFKAPSDHEPVIFSATTLLLNIVGIDALNKPLTGEFVHRPERIMAITGKKEGDIITSQDIAQVLLSDQGGRKLLPQDSRWLPIINKVDGEKEQIMAEQVAEALKQRGWDDIYFSHFLDDHWQLCRFQEEKVK